MAASSDSLHGMLMRLVQAAGMLQPEVVVPGHVASLSEIFAIHELDVDGPLAQRDLSERLRLDKSTVSRLVAGLVRKGYVERERDPANRRLDRLRLTRAGRDVHRSMASAFHDRHTQVLEGMTEAERAALRTGLAGLLRALTGGE
ncbi:MAG TPA: MarR family transcriptional regulator [Streptosporangiaceae bacterium]